MSPGDRLRSPAGYFPSQIYSKNIKKFKRKFCSEKNKLLSIRICLTILRICRRSSWSGLDALPGEKSEHLGPRKKPLVIINSTHDRLTVNVQIIGINIINIYIKIFDIYNCKDSLREIISRHQFSVHCALCYICPFKKATFPTP